jgi:hypothetical protein
MKTALEDQLSNALTHRAASVPRVAFERVLCADYHPRRQRLAVPVAVGAGATAGAATVGTVLAVVLGGAAPAYAGWSPAPTAAATTAPSPQADQSCLDALPSGQPDGVGALGSGSWQTVVTDVRGPFTVALFQDAGAYAACFTSSSFTEVTQVWDNGGSAAGSAANGTIRSLLAGGPTGGLSTGTVGGTISGDLQNVVQMHLATSADGPYSLVDGRVASGVTAVTLVLDNGQDVVTTVADGWLIAWWPGDNAATSAQVTNASGTTTETLQMADKGGPGTPPSPGACASAAGAANASKTPSGDTNVPVHCLGSGNSGESGSGPSTTGSSGAGLRGGG